MTDTTGDSDERVSSGESHGGYTYVDSEGHEHPIDARTYNRLHARCRFVNIEYAFEKIGENARHCLAHAHEEERSEAFLCLAESIRDACEDDAISAERIAQIHQALSVVPDKELLALLFAGYPRPLAPESAESLRQLCTAIRRCVDETFNAKRAIQLGRKTEEEADAGFARFVHKAISGQETTGCLLAVLTLGTMGVLSAGVGLLILALLLSSSAPGL